MAARRRDVGFTLIEMLVVTLLTATVMVFAANFYLQLTTSSTHAAELTREGRRGTALIDRVARDLESAFLVRKPPEVDPLEHPWLFLAESRDRSGAERIKFSSRSHLPRATAIHESDLAVVAYWLSPSEEEDGFDLMRWSSTALPEGLDRSFPRRDDAGVQLLASGLASFGVRFMDEGGQWVNEWDSSTLVESGELPVAAEIEISLLPLDPEAREEPEAFARRVLMPVRPLDLAEVTEEVLADEEDPTDEDCVTIAQCREANPQVEPLIAGLPEESRQALESIPPGECYADYRSVFEGFNVVLENCE